MTEDRLFVVFWLICILARIPRIVERWRAPFLCGSGWFFGVQVPTDFLDMSGGAILANYRMRLFLPLAIEIPMSAMLFLTGHQRAIFALVAIATLLTRLVYYANRMTAESAARRFQISGADKPVTSVALSLQPRSLRFYSNPWIEAVIGAALLGSLAWLSFRYAASGDWRSMRMPWTVTLIVIYLQTGLLLMKRGFVRSRCVAPAENAEQYLVWRESLRRLSAALCDYMRLALLIPLVMNSVFLTDRFKSGEGRIWMLCLVSVCACMLAWHEWRKRQQHLEIARKTRQSEFLVRRDTATLETLVCFRPLLPMLLLRGPKGYALNLASPPVRTAGLYLAGCALLLAGLTR